MAGEGLVAQDRGRAGSRTRERVTEFDSKYFGVNLNDSGNSKGTTIRCLKKLAIVQATGGRWSLSSARILRMLLTGMKGLDSFGTMRNLIGPSPGAKHAKRSLSRSMAPPASNGFWKLSLSPSVRRAGRMPRLSAAVFQGNRDDAFWEPPGSLRQLQRRCFREKVGMLNGRFA